MSETITARIQNLLLSQPVAELFNASLDHFTQGKIDPDGLETRVKCLSAFSPDSVVSALEDRRPYSYILVGLKEEALAQLVAFHGETISPELLNVLLADHPDV